MNTLENYKKDINRTILNLKKNSFLFSELVKRDFSQKYKKTTLGILWSILNPLLTLLIMRIVFTQFFGRNTNHYTIYLFAGNIVMSFFREGTTAGMTSLTANTGIISKINVPKYLFLFSRTISSFVNFLITVVVFFIFCIIDKITFSWAMLTLIVPILSLTGIVIGFGMILSALYIFFKDMLYFYNIFLTLLNYLSAIFYTIDGFSAQTQRLFLLNPVYVIIKYFRVVVIEGSIPSLNYHLLCFGYAFIFMLIGGIIYKKYNHQFIYHI